MVRNVISLLLVMMLLAVAVPVGAQDGFTLGLVLPATTGVFFEAVSHSAAFAASEAGAELVVLDSGYDVETELANVQALIDQGVDALLFSPAHAVESVEAVALANEAGIPVFMLGDLVLAEDAGLELAGSFMPANAALGELAGEAVCATVNNTGAVLAVVSVEAEETSMMTERSAGFEAYLAESCADVSISRVNVFGLGFDDALDAVLAELDAAKFGALVGLDDDTTLLAVSARDIARKADLAVIAVGTHPDLSSSLEQDKIAAIVLAEPWPLGETSVNTTLAYLNGDEAAELTVEAVLTILNAQNLDIKRCPNGVPPSLC